MNHNRYSPEISGYGVLTVMALLLLILSWVDVTKPTVLQDYQWTESGMPSIDETNNRYEGCAVMGGVDNEIIYCSTIDVAFELALPEPKVVVIEYNTPDKPDKSGRDEPPPPPSEPEPPSEPPNDPPSEPPNEPPSEPPSEPPNEPPSDPPTKEDNGNHYGRTDKGDNNPNDEKNKHNTAGE